MISHFLKDARAARQQSGKSLARQLAEILRLRRSPGRLGRSEYFYYRLFDKQFSLRDQLRFAGWRTERAIDMKMNNDSWRAVANDKLLFYATTSGLGLPFPAIRAVYHPLGRCFPGASSLRTTDEVSEFLRNHGNLPLFAKPIVGSYGRGASSIVGYSGERDELLLGSGERVPIREMIATVSAPKARGYIFQEVVVPNLFVRTTCGSRVSTVRLVVLLTSAGPQLFRAAWKIPCGTNMSDNFSHGDTGNLLGCIDLDTGHVVRVIRRVGLAMTEVMHHPDTGRLLLGGPLPDWQEARRLCLRAASSYEGLGLQHWDVALTDSGPVLLEVNVEGSMDLHQLAGRTGILDEALMKEIRLAW